MDPVEEFARLKDQIQRLQDRAEVLRAGARLRSNRFEISIKRQKRRVLNKDRLPPEIFENPSYWDVRETAVVTCHAISTFRGGDPDLVLVEAVVATPPRALTGQARR